MEQALASKTGLQPALVEQMTGTRHELRVTTNGSIRGVCVLVLVIAAVLFPCGWLGEFSPAFRNVLDRAFPDAWLHAVGHVTIFLLLGSLLLRTAPALRRRPIVYLAIMLCFAFGQEAFQAVYKDEFSAFDTLRDLVTDSCGFGMAYVFALALRPVVTAHADARRIDDG